MKPHLEHIEPQADRVFRGRPVSDGIARAQAVVTRQPFMFSHGLDPASGIVIDRSHELYGRLVRGSVLVFPRGVGSTSAGMWLLEAVLQGNAPAALVMEEIDPVLAMGALFARLFFQRSLPVVDKIRPAALLAIRTGDWVEVDGGAGMVRLLRGGREGAARPPRGRLPEGGASGGEGGGCRRC
ncbi:MAG: DUF126 domain-containing protein [Acetobacteraceae bacterium]|nr:DUF126 domain-containing protein [Acetobacteraceae bacterium]